MFIAAFFTIANTWKQPKCPTVEDWIKKILYLLYTHTHTPNRILFSNKKEPTMDTQMNMVKSLNYSELKKPGTKDYILYVSGYIKF